MPQYLLPPLLSPLGYCQNPLMLFPVIFYEKIWDVSPPIPIAAGRQLTMSPFPLKQLRWLLPSTSPILISLIFFCYVSHSVSVSACHYCESCPPRLNYSLTQMLLRRKESQGYYRISFLFFRSHSMIVQVSSIPDLKALDWRGREPLINLLLAL